MDNLRGLISRYRLRAEMSRTLADSDSCMQTSAMLLMVADRYDEMAETADAIDRTYHALREGQPDFHRSAPFAVSTSRGTADLAAYAHRHICAFVCSTEEEKTSLLPFVEDGFARGHKIFHVVDPNLRNAYRNQLTQAGIDIAGASGRGGFGGVRSAGE